MPILAYPPVRWNPFRVRGADARINIPPRTPEGSVLAVHLSDRPDNSKQALTDVVDVFARHPKHSVILYSDNPGQTRREVVEHLEGDVPTNILFGIVVTDSEGYNARVGLFEGDAPSVVLVSPPRGFINLNLGDNTHVKWVIVEGDRGEGSRPSHPVWVKALRTQCLMNGVAFRFEGWGDWVENIVNVGGSPALHVPKVVSDNHTALHVSGFEAFNSENPFDPFDPEAASSPGAHGVDAGWTLMKRVGARDAGRAIDGREWDEAPLLEEL